MGDLTADRIALDDHLAFALLKPDVVLRDAQAIVVEALRNHGLEVIHYRIGALDDSQFALMYGRTFRPDLDYWDHNRNAFRFGPVIGILLNGGKDDRMPAQQRLCSLKGSALRSGLLPNDIRRICGSTDRVFNIMHVAENPMQAREEAACWFGSTAWNKVTPKFTSLEPASELNPGWSLIEQIEAHGYGLESGLNVGLVYAAVKMRLLHALLVESGIFWRDDVVDLTSLLRSLFRSVRAGNSIRLSEAHSSVNARCMESLHSLCEFRDVAGQAGGNSCDQIFHTLTLMDGRSDRSLRTLEFFWHLTDRIRVYTSALERYLVDTMVLYPD